MSGTTLVHPNGEESRFGVSHADRGLRIGHENRRKSAEPGLSDEVPLVFPCLIGLGGDESSFGRKAANRAGVDAFELESAVGLSSRVLHYSTNLSASGCESE